LTFAEPIHSAKVQFKQVFQPEHEAILLRISRTGNLIKCCIW